jgi:hypothetical protein
VIVDLLVAGRDVGLLGEYDRGVLQCYECFDGGSALGLSLQGYLLEMEPAKPERASGQTEATGAAAGNQSGNAVDSLSSLISVDRADVRQASNDPGSKGARKHGDRQ